MDIYAVRGKYTLDLLKKYGVCDANVVLGDGGLLACDIALNKGKVPKYTVGIVAHECERKNPAFKELNQKIPNSVLLDIRKNPKKFIKDLQSCEVVISTAMHPLIACDSLRIPNLWVRLDEKAARTSRFKFYDYYSAFGLRPEPLKISEIDQDIRDFVVQNYLLTDKMVRNKQIELRETLKNISCELEKSRGKIRRNVFLNILFKITYETPKSLLILPIRVLRKFKRIIKLS